MVQRARWTRAHCARHASPTASPIRAPACCRRCPSLPRFSASATLASGRYRACARRAPRPAAPMRFRTLSPTAVLASCLVASAPTAEALDVCPAGDEVVQCSSHCHVAVPILVSGTGALNAIGLDLRFDGELQSVRAGNATRGWLVFEVQTLATGHVRFGGYDPAGFQLDGA